LPGLAAVGVVWLLTGSLLTAQTSNTAPAAPAAGTSDKPIFEEWVTIVLDGNTCGFGSTVTTKIDAPEGTQYLTDHQEQFVVKRMSITIKVTETSKIIEDAEGGVLSFEEKTEGAGSNIESKGVREGDELVVSSRGQTQRYPVPRLAALGPEAIRRQTIAVPLKPGQPFSFNTFASDYPQGVVVESGTIVGREMRNVRGVNRQLWKQTSETNVMPGMLSTAWVDDQANDVEALVVIPGIGDLHEYVTDRAECMKQPAGAEIFASSLIRPQTAIPAPKEDAQAVYRITSIDLSSSPKLWNQGEQRVLATEPGSTEIEVDVPTYTSASATWQLPHADTDELHPFLQASAYLESNAPEIQALARQAVGDEKNPVKAARLIQNFVRDYITKKDLNVGFASALETAKSREGDCTEHAVLCAALGRAVGLPTRCVVGLGYVPPGQVERALANTVDRDTGIFAFHMWAEAWIGTDEWVPMDAALNGFDVGHIAITKTAMEEVNPMVELNAGVFQLMQSLKIEVVKTTPKPPPSTTPSSSPSQEMEHSSTLAKPPSTSSPRKRDYDTLPGVD
jgi:hypothetical protein